MPLDTEESAGCRLLRAVAYDGTVVGGIAVALMSGTYALLGLPPDGPLLGLAFCGALGVYQLDRLLVVSPEDRVNQPGRRAWVRRHRWYLWMTVGGAALGSVWLAPMVRGRTLLLAAGLGAIGATYVFPVLPGGRRLKSVGWAKPLTIAGTWTAGAVLLPVMEAGQSLTAGVGALAGYRMLFVLPNVLIADWADRRGDARAGLHTVGTRWPAGRIRWSATLALAAALGGAGVALIVGAPALLAVDLIGPLLMLGAVWQVHRWERPVRDLILDLIVAWPIVPFIVDLLR